MSLNKVMLIGHLGADPELRATTSGTSVCKLRVATSKKDKDGADKTEWHSVVCFKQAADYIGKNAKKGSQVYVEGELSTRKWQDKEGNDRYSTEVVAFSVQLLGPKPKADPYAERNAERAKAATSEKAADAQFSDDDIPF